MRPTYAEVDLGAVSHNVRALAGLIGPSELCAVVKADAYGHGDVPMAEVALESGASMLAVALVEEGVRLREAGIEGPILILSEPAASSAADFGKWELTPSAYSADFIEALEATGVPTDIHLKLDTGMHRVGAQPEDVPTLIGSIESSGSLSLAAVWTHFAVADEDRVYTMRQMELFDSTVAGIDSPQHLANTAGAILIPESRRSMCRIGLGIYGLHPTPETGSFVDLQPAMRLVSHVSHVQQRKAGDRPSYGRAKPLPEDGAVVTVPVGYADGFPRSMTQYGCALIGGRRFPLAGTVTMDQIVVYVGDEDIDPGEEVVLLGRQGEDEISAREWAEDLGSIPYEVVCSIGPRVPRRYV